MTSLAGHQPKQKMIARFLSTEGEYLEATIEINGNVLCVMDDFTHDALSPGDMVNLEVFPGLYDESEAWESMFSGNPAAKKSLEHLTGWCYRAYGVVTSIKPVMVDVGLFEIEAPFQSNDDRLVGAPVAFTITRLDAGPAK